MNYICQIKRVCSESGILLYISANNGLLISSNSDLHTTDTNRYWKIRGDLNRQPALETVALQLFQLLSFLEQLEL